MLKNCLGVLVIILVGTVFTSCTTTNANAKSTAAHATPAPWHSGPHQIGTNF